MTYGVFDLTQHTQFSIRGTTGTHPDSEHVFGVHIGSDEIHADQQGFTPDFSAYDDVEWERAVLLAKWILEWDEAFRKATKRGALNYGLTDTNQCCRNCRNSLITDGDDGHRLYCHIIEETTYKGCTCKEFRYKENEEVE